MKAKTRQLWEKQDRHPGDRLRLFQAVREAVGGHMVLYPGSFIDIAPSFGFPDVTYVDSDKRAAAFFGDEAGVREIIDQQKGSPIDPKIRFIHGDYSKPLDLSEGSFDLLVSLYAGFVSEACTRYLRVGGTLLVNPSHGDAAMASIDSRYRLGSVVQSGPTGYRVKATGLDEYLVPKRPVELSAELLHHLGRGIGYKKASFAYLFTRVT